MRIDFHNYNGRFDNAIKRIKESSEVLDENKKIILKFKDYLFSANLGKPRIERYFCDLRKFSIMLNKPFRDATKEDIVRVIGDLNQTDLAEEAKNILEN
ncbi:MAG: hypothetical protein OQK82_02665 [Candidatus Pacearchaeota archaeon]|nr:hypothetical protein [Candidatus Pacearchaeota archaeon]